MSIAITLPDLYRRTVHYKTFSHFINLANFWISFILCMFSIHEYFYNFHQNIYYLSNLYKPLLVRRNITNCIISKITLLKCLYVFIVLSENWILAFLFHDWKMQRRQKIFAINHKIQIALEETSSSFYQNII